MNSVVFSVGVWLPGGGMGNHAAQIIQGLERHGMLARAYVMRNTSPDLASGKIREAYAIERMAYRVSRYSGLNQYVLRDNLFDAWVATRLPSADIFYGWTHHALWSLKRARRAGMRTILERANAHPLTYASILTAEYKKHGLRQAPYHPWILKKQLAELQAADYISVTSQFTRASLLEHGIDDHRILLTPLGVDLARFTPADAPAPEIFRVIYVGQICLRKGLPYILEAWQKAQLAGAELVLVGDVRPEMHAILNAYRQRNVTIRHEPQTAEVILLYQQAALCILPTLEDGFGLVVLEAMACGLPVIVTDQTGAKDCVRPGVDGFILPPAQVDAIVDTLTYCYQHRDQLRAMGRQARRQAEHFPWSRYQDEVVRHVQRIGE